MRFSFGKKGESQAVETASSGSGSGHGHDPEKTEVVQTETILANDEALTLPGVEARTTNLGIENADEAQVNRKLSMFKEANYWDPNLDNDFFDEIEDATTHHDAQHERRLAGDVLENSPYPEVRAAVRNYDIDVPVSTIRAWTIGLLLTTLGSGMNSLFSLRAPSISITSIVAQLVAYPIAMLWDMVFPDKEFKLFGLKFNFKPGPFNIKEHTIIVVMANANFGGGVGYFLDVLQAQNGFYKQDFGWGFGILLGWSTQMAGYGIAGLLRKLLVEPPSMIWPQQLVNCAFMYALHDHSPTDPSKTHGWSISRYRFFLWVFIGSFVWYWFPGYIAPFLSVFAFVTWIRPNNVVINQLFGGFTGLSLIPITFDWTQVTGYIFSPLVPPWHAIANTIIGMVIFFWITTIGVHYTNTWYAAYLPISDSDSYDNTAQEYNVFNILKQGPNKALSLDVEKYNNYSPLFLSTTFALTYGLSFASLTSILVHVGLFHGKEIWLRLKARKGELDDVHTKLMRHYAPAPNWWYGLLFVIMFGMAFGVCYGWPTLLTGWALVISFIIAFVFIIPIGMVQAMTNIQLGLNVITEFIIGYMQPGRPIAMMLFKTYGYITMSQALYFAQDLKLGHYLKIPQRSMFLSQTIATIWSCVVQLAVFRWALVNVENICDQEQANGFSCPGGRVFFNASVIWGLIGPARIFSPGQIYGHLQWFWLVGAVTPVLIYFAARMFPKSNIRFIQAPIVFGGTGNLPPATPLNYLSWGIIGYVFQKHIRNKYRGWWLRFNYILSAGLDCGLAISTIVIFLCLSLTQTDMTSWWGVTVVGSTLEANYIAIQSPVPAKGYFGPDHWAI